MAERFLNLNTRQITPQSQRDGSEDILHWSSEGQNNDWPQYAIKLINKSPTAQAILTTKQLYIQGEGADDIEVANFRCNPRQTVDELIQDIAADFSYFMGFALKVTWKVKNLEGDVTPASIECLPFESCRLGFDSETLRVTNIKYNPYYGHPEDFQESETITYDLWKDDIDRIKEDIFCKNYQGHVLYFGFPKPGHRFYPYPDWATALEWVGAEGEIGSFHYDNIASGFFLRTLISFVGNPDGPAEVQEYTDENGDIQQRTVKTIAESAEETIRNMFSGSKGAKVGMFFTGSKEDTPNLLPFNQQTNDDLYTNIQNIITEILARSEGIPLPLANLNSPGSFNVSGDIVRQNVDIMHSRVARFQRQIESCLKSILKFTDIENKDWKIKNYYPENDPDRFELLWDALTIEEKRNYIKENNTNFKLIENADPVIN